MELRRGDIVIVPAPGDYGKPRPAVIIQSDIYRTTHASFVVCLLTSDVGDFPIFRLTIEPNKTNGLHETSQIMADKIMTFKGDKISRRIGVADDKLMVRLSRAVASFLQLG